MTSRLADKMDMMAERMNAADASYVYAEPIRLLREGAKAARERDTLKADNERLRAALRRAEHTIEHVHALASDAPEPRLMPGNDNEVQELIRTMQQIVEALESRP